MARVNVELKARDPDPEATLARCMALGAEDRGFLEQRDTYFVARRSRLKFREQGSDGSELIAWGRPDVSEPKESTYVLAPVAEPEPMLEALEYALGPSVVVVSKRRHLLMWEGVRIHLDQVDELGAFVEFEAVLPDAGDVSSAHEKLARLRGELGVVDANLVSGGYASLLMSAPQVLLRAAEEAMRNAYAPHSGVKVGAALRGASGAVYSGANVESVAYLQCQCAEASAIGAMVVAGETALTAVAIVAERLDECPPCDGCRQRLAEFGAAGTPVYLGQPGTEPHVFKLGDLLRESFGREALKT